MCLYKKCHRPVVCYNIDTNVNVIIKINGASTASLETWPKSFLLFEELGKLGLLDFIYCSILLLPLLLSNVWW